MIEKKDDGKTEKGRGPPEATLPRITKLAIGVGLRVQPRTTFPLTRKKSKHSKRSKKRKRKRRYSSSF